MSHVTRTLIRIGLALALGASEAVAQTPRPDDRAADTAAIRVVFYGDTAVATFVADLDVANGDNKGTQKLTLLDVYHKEPGGWIQVASNTSLHADELKKLACPPKP